MAVFSIGTSNLEVQSAKLVDIDGYELEFPSSIHLKPQSSDETIYAFNPPEIKFVFRWRLIPKKNKWLNNCSRCNKVRR